MNIVERLRYAEKRAPNYGNEMLEAADVIENLTALVNRLCRQINLVDPRNDVAFKAADYMHRNNLTGISLQRDDEGIGKLVDMVMSAKVEK